MRKLLILIVLNIVCINYAMSQKTVTGVVSSEDGMVMPGVTVVVKGTTIGTITNEMGQYSVEVPEENDVLVFSFIGMKTQEISIGNQSAINVTMLSDVIGLEEVVAIGYGTERRGNITGAISSVTTQDIQEMPIIDAGSALQGRAAGVMALASGNRPGDGVTIRIRGRRSLTATNDPLYVIDGIPYEGNINDINPRDIKSMEILKDASATAIYGSRGANGVILVTTTRGGNYPTTVSYNGYYGVTSPLGKPDLMNGEQYTRLKEVGGRPFTSAEEDAIERGVSTDWLDLVVGNGYQQSHQLGVRGGNEKTAFSIASNLFDEQAVIETQKFTRKTLRINLDHNISDRIRVGTSTQLSDQIQNYGSNVYGGAVNISPLAEPYEDGEMVYQPGADPLLWNPLADFVEDAIADDRTRLRVFSNLYAEIDITNSLSYRMNYGNDYQKYTRGLFQGSLSSERQFSTPRALKNHEENFTYTFENILNYTKVINENNTLKATGLFSVQESDYEMTIIDVEGLPYEHQLFHNLETAETVLDYDSDLQEWGIMSFMGRVNYELFDRYLFTVTGRYDGSSRLSEGKKWGFFPSAAFLWRISNENFMSSQTLFSDLRFRVSYGVTGNTGITPYQTRGGLTRTIYSFGDGSGYGYRPGTIANPDLKWESSATTNIGLDFGIGDNIAGSFEVYQTNTTDLLLERKIPITSGFDNVMENIGETRNRGWELTLNGRIISTRDLTWSANLNLFGNKEEIVDLYGNKTDDIGNEWFIGEPLTVWYDYDKIGIWQLDEASQADVYQANPGEIKIRDVVPDDKINEEDRVILGTNIPKATLGLGSRLMYKDFEFSFLLLGIFGQTIYNEFEVNHATLQGRYNNLDVDFWTEDNPTNDHPKPDGSREYPLYSESRGYSSGDFLKIRNMQLGYNLPKQILSDIGIKSMKIYLNAETPFIFSRLSSNLDPESYDGVISSETPSTRMFSLGINVDF
ncbi:TonB-linked outer membrane protein, SusC/RagA family [Tangfeifania diversioriginum]|uniref:TonB-linked outer membrane protein, SusC/RagA family n=2 Tax=Tangfeifania diversioriginum TaxID=1168035 RepID=A0A1M6DTM5_9BACT|nr:TonB-linked outer membrane protein, SusC/RagA family [Tangfeifania diversioriginum]